MISDELQAKPTQAVAVGPEGTFCSCWAALHVSEKQSGSHPTAGHLEEQAAGPGDGPDSAAACKVGKNLNAVHPVLSLSFANHPIRCSPGKTPHKPPPNKVQDGPHLAGPWGTLTGCAVQAGPAGSVPSAHTAMRPIQDPGKSVLLNV